MIQFLREVIREFRRIAWPSGRTVARAIAATVAVLTLVAVLVLVLDVAASSGIRALLP